MMAPASSIGSVLSPVEDIVAEIRAGRMVVLVDEEDRENEGDLVIAAEHCTPEAVNFMAKFGRGLICLTLTENRCRQLNLQQMVRDNRTPHGTAFTVSIEAAEGVTTGISAHDRSRTVLAAVAPDGSFNEGSALVWAQLHHALWNLWTATGDPAYHEALARVVAYAETQQGDTGVGGYFEFPYIYGLWANEPITELYRERPDDTLQALVFAVGDDVLSRQYSDRGTGVSPSDCAYTGGWTPTDGHSAPNWNHTIKLEAMADAYRLAELTGDADRMERYGHAARIGAAWLMGDQYRGDETDTFAVPGEAIGGIPLFDADPDVRVDIPGHGSIALLKVSQWVVGEAAPGSL